MAVEKYTELYALQDRVLEIVFADDNDFYLTGGTCLHRFYIEKRYSDDLDFFSGNSAQFSFQVRYLRDRLRESYACDTIVETRDFVRMQIKNKLQVDFINDHVYYYGKVDFTQNGNRLDNVMNILANKLTAIMSRNEPKDVFDLALICGYFEFDWMVIIQASQKKMLFEIDELLVRLKLFPLELLKNIKATDSEFVLKIPEYIELLIEEIKDEGLHKSFLQ